jgi:hypothetical protein
MKLGMPISVLLSLVKSNISAALKLIACEGISAEIR